MDASPIDATPDTGQLDRLADVAVRVGLNLQNGQDLVMTAPVEALPLVRRIAAAAYRAGAGFVQPVLSDGAVTRARYLAGDDAALDAAPGWLYRGMSEAFAGGAARLHVSAEDPMLLADQDPVRVARAAKSNAMAYRPALQRISGFEINWSICAYPSVAWARQMFPDLAEADAVVRLSDAIVAASRLDAADPVAAWAEHNAELDRRTDWLTRRAFAALRYRGPGTDLTLGLADGHAWRGGASTAKNGVRCNPNIPTEEVFTTPHAQRTDGTLRASKPLAHQGTVIDGIEVRFEAGRIIEARARTGEATFLRLLDSDEGARRLGEVALVPHSSPISQSGLLFYNTLFDENAASHVALGRCYADCFTEAGLGEDEIARRGGNDSMIHVDWMVGSAELDIDGLDAEGAATPLMRGGEWAEAV